MNFLSNLEKSTTSKKKRLGRGIGSGKGGKSGRGTTRHQAAREAIPLHFEGGQGKISKKFPLLRGKGKNKSVKQKPLIIGLDDLAGFKASEVVTVDALIKKNIIDEKAKKIGVKILNKGKLDKKLTVAVAVSASVKSTIEKLGGSVKMHE